MNIYLQITGAIGLALALVVSGNKPREISHREENAAPAYALVRAVDDIVLDEMAKRNYIGCAVGVVQGGKIIHLNAYGHLDELRTNPVTTGTIFRWGSISKVLTSLAAWKLIDNGKLSLNTKVVNKVPYWHSDGNKDDITVGQLLSHRSGINHYTNYNQKKYKSDEAFDAEQCVKVFRDAPLNFTPGTANQYTTFGYNLLGAVVEEVSNKGYVEYVKNNIKDPLGLTSLKENFNGHQGYEMTCNGGLKHMEEGDVLWKLPGGGWSSNIEDLAKLEIGMMNNSILANTSEIWQPVPNNNNFCYDLTNKKAGSEVRISHGGANDEIRTEMAFYPNTGFGVVVIINGNSYADAKNLAQRIEKYYGKKVSPEELGAKNSICNQGACSGTSGNDRLVGIWNYNVGETTVWRRRLGEDQFHAEWDWLQNIAGYQLTHIQTYLGDNEVRYWDGIFKKSGTKSALYRNYTTDGFHDKWEEMNGKGYRLIDLETYTINNTRYWAGVFEPGTGTYNLYRNYKTNDFVAKVNELAGQNLRLIDVEVYKDDDDNLVWSGVWRSGTPSHFYYGKSLDDMPLLNKSEAVADYNLLKVCTYMVNGQRKWAGIYAPSTSSQPIFLADKSYCELASSDSNYISINKASLIDLEIYK